MNFNIGVIVTMIAIAVGSSVGQSILNSQGKQSEAQYVDLAAKSIISATALSLFGKLLTTMITLR